MEGSRWESKAAGARQASLRSRMAKNPPAVWETWVRCLGWEDALEESMATHCSVLAWESHGQRSLVGYSPRGHKESDTTERLSTEHGRGQSELTGGLFGRWGQWGWKGSEGGPCERGAG